MEQFDHDRMTGASPNAAAGVVAFDVLRAMIAARQAASPTARIVSRQRTDGNAGAHVRRADSLISLFARGDANAAACASFASDEAVIRNDERHA